MVLDLQWELKVPHFDLPTAVANEIRQIAKEQMPDIADLFPFHRGYRAQVHFDEYWMAVRMTAGAEIPHIEQLQGNELEELCSKALPFVPRNHRELNTLLGPLWISPETFTYIGSFRKPLACWPDVAQHVVDWLNQEVLPHVLKLNQRRVLRAIPQPPSLEVARILDSLWVLECDESLRQGTAFVLTNGYLVTAHMC